VDSLTQIVLGAAVGEAVLGRKVGNKAMLYGAIAGTIPDLDVIARQFTDTVRALEVHRGFTHSIVFSVVFAPVFGWLVSRYESYKDFKGWSWLFFWAFVTHPLLDAHTTWGTQLFWPFDLRLAFKNIFVIDPLYTLPFLVFLILALRQKRASKKRRKYNTIGLVISSTYLALSIILKGLSFQHFKSALEEQNISYTEIQTRPAPMNTILWSANVEREDEYLMGNYSFLDTQPITFHSHPKNHELLGELVNDENVQRMISISKGWYTISKEDESLYFNDLRFGLLSVEPIGQNFFFKYKMTWNSSGEVIFTEEPKTPEDGKQLLIDLWQRINGN
jgi:inner membrane protein